MSSSLRAEKRACAVRGDPLSNASILQHILSFINPRLYLYIAGVSNLWQQSYECVALEPARKTVSLEWRRAATEVPRRTRYSSAFGSVTLLTWAFTSGLALDADNQLLQRAAGAHGSLLTLAVAHGLGLEFNEHTLYGAIDSNREPIVDFLHSEHRCPMFWYMGFTAARSGNVRMLKFLRERGCEFSHFAMCSDAAVGGLLETLKYLRQEGCSWFEPTIAGSAARSGNLDMVGMLRKPLVYHWHILALANNARCIRLCNTSVAVNTSAVVNTNSCSGCCSTRMWFLMPALLPTQQQGATSPAWSSSSHASVPETPAPAQQQ
jgi:hypothetical protein